MAKKDTELAAVRTKLETFEKHQSDLQEHITVLHSSNKSKETHIQNLQQEVSSKMDNSHYRLKFGQSKKNEL